MFAIKNYMGYILGGILLNPGKILLIFMIILLDRAYYLDKITS